MTCSVVNERGPGGGGEAGLNTTIMIPCTRVFEETGHCTQMLGSISAALSGPVSFTETAAGNRAYAKAGQTILLEDTNRKLASTWDC